MILCFILKAVSQIIKAREIDRIIEIKILA